MPCRRHRPDGRRRALDRGSPVPIRQPLTRSTQWHAPRPPRCRRSPPALLADGDLIPVIDVSDTTMSSTGTNKSSPSRSWPRPQRRRTPGHVERARYLGVRRHARRRRRRGDGAGRRSGSARSPPRRPGRSRSRAGSVTGITDLAVADGGTGGSTAAATDLANLTSTTLVADGDILRDPAGAAAITRANLAADEAFSSRFDPRSNGASAAGQDRPDVRQAATSRRPCRRLAPPSADTTNYALGARSHRLTMAGAVTATCALTPPIGTITDPARSTPGCAHAVHGLDDASKRRSTSTLWG